MVDPAHDEVFGIARELAAATAPLKTVLLAHQKEQERIQTILRQAGIGRPLLQQVPGLLKLQQEMDATRSIAAAMNANSSLAQLLATTRLDAPTVSGFANELSAAASISQLALPKSILSDYLKLTAGGSLAASIAAQEKLRTFGKMQVGGLVSADSTFRRSTASHLFRLSSSFGSLLDATNSTATLAPVAPLIANRAPVSYYRHVDAIESLTIEPDDESYSSETIEDSVNDFAPSVDELLLELDAELHSLLVGARQAVQGSNVDRARHVTTSLRELVTHVLHKLAPNDDVRQWSSDPKHLYNGNPTRRARLLYICRDIDSDPLSDYLSAEFSAALALIDTLNQGTHVVRTDLNGFQLGAMVVRVESLLIFLLGLVRITSSSTI